MVEQRKSWGFWWTMQGRVYYQKKILSQELPLELFELDYVNFDMDGLPAEIKFRFGLTPPNPMNEIELAIQLEIFYRAKNQLIFCLRNQEPEQGTFDAYNAVWEVPKLRIRRFAENLAKALSQKTDVSYMRADTGEDFPFGSRRFSVVYRGEQNNLADGPIIFWDIDDVYYIGGNGRINFSPNYPWSWLKTMLFHTPYLKRKNYADQHETRIVFFTALKDGDRFIGLNPKDETVRVEMSSDLRSQIREHV